MKQCCVEDCENMAEGRTEMCARHNRAYRKAQSITQKEKAPRTRIKPVSDKQTFALLEYSAQLKVWREGKECTLKDQHCSGRITCHHKRGRGKYLLDQSTWIPVCMHHHSVIENNPEWAYENGLSEPRLKNYTI